jgi:hypothetical protein
MLLFLIMLSIVVAGLAAIEFSQAPRPRTISVWSDEAERRLLKSRFGPNDSRFGPNDRW